jgi:hypothetical protein
MRSFFLTFRFLISGKPIANTEYKILDFAKGLSEKEISEFL